MKIRLSGGVVTSGQRAWVPGRSGPVEIVDDPALPLGAPIALGPDGASPEQVQHAVDELTRLVDAGGTAAAGAGVSLGPGFRSARLAGARGDQRDAVLAALGVLGVAQADRLGDRAGFLVALFGPEVTKRVGAAAAQAISEGRWAAVKLASAASDALGPEQLERILALRPPSGADVVPGPASALAQHLRLVLAPLPEPRRLELLLDLWAQVGSHHAEVARRERLLATQGRRDRTEDLRKRRRYDDDESLLTTLRGYIVRPEQRLADVARWVPPDWYWRNRLNGILQDALATTTLLRTAAAVGDHGLAEGLARSADLLEAVAALLPGPATAAGRKVPGMTGLPVHPGAYVRDIHRRIAKEPASAHKFKDFMGARLACARDFALVVMRDLRELVDGVYDVHDQILRPSVPDEVLRAWAVSDLRNWRKGVGYSPVRPPAEWAGIHPWTARLLGDREPLSQRLTAKPGSDTPDASGASGASDVELVGDLLWYAEMLDALAVLHGHESAQGPHGTGFPWLDYDPAPPAEPLSPRLDSVTLAVSGAAQLVALGGTPPKRVGAWRDFTGGLLASTSIAEALTGEFRVPAPLAALDGTTLPGTGFRLQVARSARTLAQWSDYMGNCIASPYYVERARAGRSVLTGLYDKDDALIINAELVARRPVVRGWRIEEIQARFNQSPDEALERRFRAWVEAIPGDVSEGVPPPPDEPPPSRPERRRPVPRLVEDAGPALSALAQRAWTDEVDGEVMGTFAALAGTAPDAALARLRRLGSASLADACKRTLDAGTVSLPGLWAASGVRPLRTAVAALDPGLGDRFDQLSLLFSEPPMPKSLRRLVKLPAIADAYALDLVARSVRKAIGTLAVEDDEVIARAFAGRTTEELVCALAVMITCRAPGIDLITVATPRVVTTPRYVKIPGYPATTLEDENGPWQRALPDARELGADTTAFWDEIAKHGLRIPASWLGGGTWTTLWTRAHR